MLEKYKDAELYAWRARGHYRLDSESEITLKYAEKSIQANSGYFMGYLARGNGYNYKGEYDKAISDYNKAIELKPDNPITFNNRGNSWYNKGNYDKAISDFDKAIELKPDYAFALNNRGVSWNNKGEHDKAISDYDKAIELKSDIPIIYYNRGNTHRLKGKDIEKAKSDYECYLSLTPVKDDIQSKLAKEFIAELDEKLKYHGLNEISEITDKIKKLLIIEKGCITHYTSLSTVKILIFDKESKFRISEGSFLNDTSEGTELFNFLGNQLFTRHIDGLLAETFAPKPFIGSFVSEDKHDDLNMWRFYGKEANEEAKGCAITIRMSEFVDGINDSLAKETSEKSFSDSDDIKFYRVAYWNHDNKIVHFHIPNAEDKEEELNQLMQELKSKVTDYTNEDKSVLEKYLNAIAFLFKSDAYKNENEIRLVVKGVEFEKKFDERATPPKVYIELINIRGLIEQITLGPKVDKPDEWASAFHFQYDNEYDDNKKPKKILISRLPYK